ncbi:hypothetical protein BD309DRAFT_253295 [Dichomitus squalens]|uniref:Uncharacterized protein n=1 Tax=Dichomitus squalens TaxID=114155 RepID=A0A4Q9QAL3_9APHY|nr:hypothetical protein BD309DRAFT_253295 [Dichomitus squalens]TBU64300.1 hypothetical protein BD310DRAFT_972712 [Dichomitus squalens]
MAEEYSDNEIEFDFDNEANEFALPTGAQCTAPLPDTSVDAFEALYSAFFLAQYDERPDASAATSSLDHPHAFSQPTPQLRPFNPPVDALGEENLPACIDPSATYQQTSIVPAPPPPNQNDPPFPAVPSLPRAKRPRAEQSENTGSSAELSSRKRRRTAVPPTAIVENGRIFSTPVLYPETEAAHTTVQDAFVNETSTRPRADDGAAPPAADKENVPAVSGPARKRTRTDELDGGPSGTSKRRKKQALLDAPETINAPPLLRAPLHVGGYARSSALGGTTVTASTIGLSAPGEQPSNAGCPQSGPELYRGLRDARSQAQQGSHQLSSTTSGTPQPTSDVRGPPAPRHRRLAAQNAPAGPSRSHAGPSGAAQAPPLPPKAKRTRLRPPAADPRSPSASAHPSRSSAKPSPKPVVRPKAVARPKANARRACPVPLPSSGAPCPRTFSRETDVHRHILHAHLGVRTYCVSAAHARGSAPIARHDGLKRHFASEACLGGRDAYDAAWRALAEQLSLSSSSSSSSSSANAVSGALGVGLGVVIGAGSARETGEVRAEVRREAQRALGRALGRIAMPCYQAPGFWAAVAHLPAGRTPLQLERWLGRHARVVRCRCGACEGMADWELDVRPDERTAGPVAGPSSAGGLALEASTRRGDDDKMPPEEEEGVEEDPPTRQQDMEANSALVLNPESTVPHHSEVSWDTPAVAPPSLDDFWAEWLDAGLLFQIEPASDHQPENTTPIESG